MNIKQISVFLENKKGRLVKVIDCLAEEGINVRALSLADTKDFGVLRIIVNDPDKTAAVLKKCGFVVQETDVIGIEVEDRPGGLSKILEILDSEDLNVEYMYATVEHTKDKAVVIFKIDEYKKAVEALKARGIGVIKSDVLEKL
jgi:hypothetical protein